MRFVARKIPDEEEVLRKSEKLPVADRNGTHRTNAERVKHLLLSELPHVSRAPLDAVRSGGVSGHENRHCFQL